MFSTSRIKLTLHSMSFTLSKLCFIVCGCCRPGFSHGQVRGRSFRMVPLHAQRSRKSSTKSFGLDEAEVFSFTFYGYVLLINLENNPLNLIQAIKAEFHGFNRLRVAVDQDEVAAKFVADHTGGAAACEKVKHGVAQV